MSEQNRTVSEYLERFARQHCNGNVEQAKETAIAKEVSKTLKED